MPYRWWTRGMWKSACHPTFERNVFIVAKQKRYGKEFKRQAVELVVRQGYTKAEATGRVGQLRRRLHPVVTEIGRTGRRRRHASRDTAFWGRAKG